MLKPIFFALLDDYKVSVDLKDKLWIEIEKKHGETHRAYHTLQHLESLYKELEEVKDSIDDWAVVLFSLFYHDIIYNPLKSNNEAKSAGLAANRLTEIGVLDTQVIKCVAIINATRTHDRSDNNDINLFTDADISILGASWEVYHAYSKHVRSEYSIYPDFMCNKGRKKVLQHFLGMDNVYKTTHFLDKYEVTCKVNLKKELDSL